MLRKLAFNVKVYAYGRLIRGRRLDLEFLRQRRSGARIKRYDKIWGIDVLTKQASLFVLEVYVLYRFK